MAEAAATPDLVFAYLDGYASNDQKKELWRRLPEEPGLARHLAVQSVLVSVLERLGRQHSEEVDLKRAASALPRRGRHGAGSESPSILRFGRMAVAAALVIAAIGVYLLLRTPASTTAPPPVDDVAKTAGNLSQVSTQAPPEGTGIAEGPALFEDDFEQGLERWIVPEAAAGFVSTGKVWRDGEETRCLVIDTKGGKDRWVIVAPRKAASAAAMVLEYDYRIAEPGGPLCPFFGFTIADPATAKKTQILGAKPADVSRRTAGVWTHARIEFFGMRCPKMGPFVWARRFEDGKPLCSYYVPSGMDGLRVGSFLAGNIEVALDNVAVRALKPAKE